jgi:hypothetical protein
MFGWPKLESAFLFGWWTVYDFVAKVWIGTASVVLWGGYYYFFWPKLKDGVPDE